MRVFISYHTPDLEKARAIEAALVRERPGIDCFVAPRVLTAGAYWLPRLADEIARSDAVLFLAGARIGPWQELEYYEALNLSKRPERAGRPRLVPVIIVGSAPGLSFFSLLHQIYAPEPAAPESLTAILAALDDSATPEPVPAWRHFQPYKGLPALQEADTAFFFGREKDTAQLIDHLAQTPDKVIALIGQSGVGKSSLARAGVLARLKSQERPAGTEWPSSLHHSRSFLPLVLRPGTAPLKELALALAKLYSVKSFELDEEAEGWAKRFMAGARLSDMLRVTSDRIAETLDAEPPKRFVVYLDQGEELYTRARPDEARRFSSLMAEAAEHEAFSVMLSLRSDYYTAFQNDRDVFHASERIDVLPLTRDVLIDVIRKPALSLGARFESDEMAPRIAAATERESGALPLLSDLMHDMWLNMLSRGDGTLRWSDNPEIIDVSAPLKKRAEALLKEPAIDEAVVRRLFTLHLTQVPQKGDPVRRQARRSECSADEWNMAEKLAGENWRLLTLSRADGAEEPLVEVAHEQLLRSWPRLRGWIEDEREFLVWKGEVEHANAEYLAAPEGERAGALLMGRRLSVARTWFERRGNDLMPGVRSYVADSIRSHDAAESEREHERRERQIAEMRVANSRRVFAFGGVALALICVVAGFAAWEWRTAELARQAAQVAENVARTAEQYAQQQRLAAVAAETEAMNQRDRANRVIASAAQHLNEVVVDLAGTVGSGNGPQTMKMSATLDNVGKLMDVLQDGDDSNPVLRSGTSKALNQGSAALLAAGATNDALAWAQKSQSMMQAVVDKEPDNPQYQSDLSESNRKMGDVLMAEGDVAGAQLAYNSSETIQAELAAKNAASETRPVVNADKGNGHKSVIFASVFPSLTLKTDSAAVTKVVPVKTSSVVFFPHGEAPGTSDDLFSKSGLSSGK